jgi:AcrR family transcriptional regulator
VRIGEARVASRGRPARFSRAGIVAAAEAVVRADGIGALSMRRVARELGSSPMALYRHVGGKDDLLRLLLDHIAGDLRRPASSDDPRRTVTRIATITHDWLVAHPWAIDVLPPHLPGWSVAWIVDDMLAAFLAAGLSPAAAARAYEVIWHHLVGELATSHSTHADAPTPHPPAAEALAQYPTLAALAPHTAVAQAHDQFLHGLAALLDGLLGPSR